MCRERMCLMKRQRRAHQICISTTMVSSSTSRTCCKITSGQAPTMKQSLRIGVTLRGKVWWMLEPAVAFSPCLLLKYVALLSCLILSVISSTIWLQKDCSHSKWASTEQNTIVTDHPPLPRSNGMTTIFLGKKREWPALPLAYMDWVIYPKALSQYEASSRSLAFLSQAKILMRRTRIGS